MDKDYKNYWSMYTEQLVDSLSANIKLKEFTRNTDVIGAYAEITITEFIKRFSSPLLCSTGTVISPSLTKSGNVLKQLDLMLWSPTPLPAIFEVSSFALVPEQCVHGVIEIKRSAYTNVGKAIKENIDWVENHVEGFLNINFDLAAKLKEKIKNNSKGSKLDVSAIALDDLLKRDKYHIALGVICIREQGQNDKVLDDLISDGRALVLQEVTKSGEIKVNISHVLQLIEFLKIIKIRSFDKLKTYGNSIETIGSSFGEKIPGSLLRE